MPIGEPIDATFMPYSSSRWRSLVISRLRELHHVLDAAADVDESQAVVLQPERGEGGELLDGRFLIGRFVGEAGEHHLGFVGHGEGNSDRAFAKDGRNGRIIAPSFPGHDEPSCNTGDCRRKSRY